MSKNFLFLRIFLLSKKPKNIYSSSKKNILIKKQCKAVCLFSKSTNLFNRIPFIDSVVASEIICCLSSYNLRT